MNLDGLDGTQLFGFMAAVGTLTLLNERAKTRGEPAPRIWFGRDGTARVEGGFETREELSSALFDQLQLWRPFLREDLADVEKPADFTADLLRDLAEKADARGVSMLAGLVACFDEQAFESTLCAANGASHQKLIQSMRDILALVDGESLRAALFTAWKRSYEVPGDARRALDLGTRKPTLRLDPGDERLYALRLSDPTSSNDYRTELGGQALAVPAFSALPVVPQRRPVTVSSRRVQNRVFFSWVLWERPSTLATVRSVLFAGAVPQDELRARGAFAAFRAARVSGAKGKLSFAPTEGVW